MKTGAYLRKVKDHLLYRLQRTGCFDSWSDEKYLRLIYRWRTGSRLDLANPQTFNEKLQWLKLNDRQSIYTRMVDKAAAKEYIAEKIGAGYTIPTLGVWERFEDIDFTCLPDQFVLKCTHNSGGLVICRDKARLDLSAARDILERCLARDYYLNGREWPYKDVPRRIIAEAYIEDADSPDGTLTDYKVFCFGGTPRIIMTVKGGHGEEKRTVRRMYDPEWKLYEVGLHGKAFADNPEPRPDALDEMLRLAGKLSEGLRHLRVDFYVVGGKVYIGELTFYHMSGMERFEPASFDRMFGDFIEL